MKSTAKPSSRRSIGLGGGAPARTLAWGDRVEVLEGKAGHLKVRTRHYPEGPDGSVGSEPFTGYLRVPRRVPEERIVVPPDEAAVLKVDFVDVQQGDASVIETPDGKVILVDGGDNQLFARYLAARFPGTGADRPKEIDCILVSHGDADHFAGLTELAESETNNEPGKRLFIHPRRVFHNGLVKRPSSVREADQLGATREFGDETVITGLEADLLAVPDDQMNEPFRAWKRALERFRERGPIEFERLAMGDDEAFSFLAEEGITVQVLGPIESQVDGEPGLRFLGEPSKKPFVSHPSQRAATYSGKSVSHTINGHSVVIRLAFGSWRFLFTGDLNEQAADTLTGAQARGEVSLRSEVFKVPHHGSADFSHSFFRAVSPVLSVVSSGDENARKEYIHPRATLLAGLGRHGRSEDSVFFVTELVAFFETVGWAYPTKERGGPADLERPFFGFRRAAWGLVKVRTDGKRLLVFTNSASARLKEAYAFTMEQDTVSPARVEKV
ncbi:MAG: MBL fold metallo-hydrolase [Actinomycetota bacterium]|nr:MBL fold metallo-hydrolase [Actinomycetota bacterium]